MDGFDCVAVIVSNLIVYNYNGLGPQFTGEMFSTIERLD